MIDGVFNVLFLCTGNAARSIIAEAILNQIGAARFRAFSAGRQPLGYIHPNALSLLDSLDYPTHKLRSKSWHQFARPGAVPLDFVFTLCDQSAGEFCSLWPGQSITAHWGMSDPSAVKGGAAEIGAAFAYAHRLLLRRIQLLTALPTSGLDAFSLQTRVREIGMAEIVRKIEPAP
ncbi:MAG: arsenate reductase ArsC [Xanthobacteraceae bacterium]|nr:arsenate reductase ArsC [Xanthobacteraceae bacterium]